MNVLESVESAQHLEGVFHVTLGNTLTVESICDLRLEAHVLTQLGWEIRIPMGHSSTSK